MGKATIKSQKAAQAKSAASTAKGDFGKRLKAKVGKRAPQALNSTDTDFSTASIKVKPQDALNKQQQQQQQEQQATIKQSQLLVSSRGNTLDQLSHQLLHHHAPAARISAMKGILDSLKQQRPSSSIVEANLSVLVPLLAKCFVDSDDTVRQLAREAQQFIYESVESIHVFEPFLPLHVAYLCSAFNSLVDTVRNDALEGVTQTTLFFLKCVNDKHTNLTEGSLQCHYGMVERLLPSYARLLSASTSATLTTTTEQRIQHGNKTTRGGRNKKQKTNKSDPTANKKEIEQACRVLNSLASLLRWNQYLIYGSTDMCANLDSSVNEKPLQMNYHVGGTNAILLCREKVSTVLSTQLRRNNNIKDLLIGSVTGRKGVNQCRVDLSDKVGLEIMQKMCDKWVEIVQRGHIHGTGVSLHHLFLEESSYLVACMRFFLRQFGTILVNYETSSKSNSVTKNLVRLVLEAFPVKDDSGNRKHAVDYNRINVAISCFLCEVAGIFPSVEDGWVDCVFDYILPLLKPCEKIDDNVRCDVLDVVSLLLQKSGMTDKHTLSEESRLQLLKSLDENVLRNSSREFVNQSELKAIRLLCHLVWQSSTKSVTLVLLLMSQSLPLYLNTLGSKFQSDTLRILDTLRHACRIFQDMDFSHEKKQLEDSILSGILAVLQVSKKGKKNTVSPFEAFPESVQRSIIGLLALLESPSRESTDALASICLRLGCTNDKQSVAKYIYETIFSIRKSITLEAYINFLTGSTILAIRKPQKSPISNTLVFDYTTHLLVNAVLQTGPTKIVPSLLPLLKECLHSVNRDNPRSLMRCRTALIILAACRMDEHIEPAFDGFWREFISNEEILKQFLLFCVSTEDRNVSQRFLSALLIVFKYYDIEILRNFISILISQSKCPEDAYLSTKDLKALVSHFLEDESITSSDSILAEIRVLEEAVNAM